MRPLAVSRALLVPCLPLSFSRHAACSTDRFKGSNGWHMYVSHAVRVTVVGRGYVRFPDGVTYASRVHMLVHRTLSGACRMRGPVPPTVHMTDVCVFQRCRCASCCFCVGLAILLHPPAASWSRAAACDPRRASFASRRACRQRRSAARFVSGCFLFRACSDGAPWATGAAGQRRPPGAPSAMPGSRSTAAVLLPQRPGERSPSVVLAKKVSVILCAASHTPRPVRSCPPTH